MHISDFDYTLPDELIAKHPLDIRSHSKLMRLDKNSQTLSHFKVNELADLLNPGDLMIFNNSKVIKARLFGKKSTGGKIELLLERVIDSQHCLVHIKSSKSPKIDSVIIIENYHFKIIDRKNGLYTCQLIENTASVLDVFEQHGHMPLPPYLNRDDDAADCTRYQTVYAKDLGSVAAPTAGLHFDETLLSKLEKKGINTAFITLHVGAGTFQPVRVDDINNHHMHSEWIEVKQNVIDAINTTKANHGRVIAVGTTSVRSLETVYQNTPTQLSPYTGETDIFIYPGYKFGIVDAIFTNFHLPKSSLLMLVSAFAGHEFMHKAYQTAIAEKYRFYSYGDAMLII